MPITQPSVGFVLVHGGLHGGWCWDSLRPLLAGPSVAVDLPGRSGRSEDHAGITYEDWVQSATQQAETIGADQIILVGHSMAGITIPQVAIRLGQRVRAIVFLAAVVPPEGEAFAPHYAGSEIVPPTWDIPPSDVTAGFLCTEMTDGQCLLLLARLVAEPAAPLLTPITRRGVPDIPAIYVRAEGDFTGLGQLEADRLALDFPQLKLIDAPGGHNLMLTRPNTVADILNALAH